MEGMKGMKERAGQDRTGQEGTKEAEVREEEDGRNGMEEWPFSFAFFLLETPDRR
jgi:hypothetical protein